MNKSRLLGAVCAAVFTFITTSSHSTLLSRLGGAAAYDDALDITWLTDADLSGRQRWDTHLFPDKLFDWIDSLNTAEHLGFNDWRLASMSVSAPVGSLPDTTVASSVIDCSSATEVDCRDNELGYMYYQNMGGTYGSNLSGNQTVDGILLTDVQPLYWSGTEFDSGLAWRFAFNNGHNNTDNKNSDFYGWAVLDGDVAAVPSPPVLWLIGTGLLGLIGMTQNRYRRSNRKCS